MEAVQTAQDLRFPIGKFHWKGDLNEAERAELISQIAAVPARLRKAVKGLTAEQLDTPYRPEGWTVRQVVHHVPDSHANAFIRFKLALTEYEPTIKTYKEDMWAKLPDVPNTPIEVSLELLSALQARWVALLRGMDSSDFARTLRHPEIGVVDLNRMLALYAWHSAHHTAHITSLRKRMGWD